MDQALQVNGLTRRFGRLVAVENLDLKVNVGDVYGFLGPNGAGKTTAIRCILGLIRCDEGTVSLFGHGDTPAARRHVGAIVETPSFHEWMSGWDNLALSCAYLGLTGQQAKGEFERVLARVEMTERSRDRTGTYSLGMKQRLGLARALLGKPKLLVLDEPTNGLDPKGMREVRDLIRSLAHQDGITVFISSHLLSEVQAMCNRVGILQKGKLVAEGSVDEFISGGHEGACRLEVGAQVADKLNAALQQLDGATVVGPGQAGRLLVVLDELTPAAFNRHLMEQGVEVTALVPQERSLEDVFLEVTR